MLNVLGAKGAAHVLGNGLNGVHKACCMGADPTHQGGCCMGLIQASKMSKWAVLWSIGLHLVHTSIGPHTCPLGCLRLVGHSPTHRTTFS